MKDPRQLEMLLPELTFPGRDVITATEVAGKLGLSLQHVHNCIEDQRCSLTAVNIGRRQRGAYRIPVSSYYAWLTSCLTSVPADNPVLQLETAKLIPLFRQLAARLELRGEHPIKLLSSK
jgi:hypothetical protein